MGLPAVRARTMRRSDFKMSRSTDSPPPRRPTKRLAAPERRRHILAAARHVFVERGYAGARVIDISRAAGVNEAILYRHFPSKEALFEAAVAEPLRERVEQLLQLGDGAQEALSVARTEYMADLLEALLAAVKELAPLLGVMVFGGGELGREFYIAKVMPAITECAAAIEAHDADWQHRDFPARTVVMMAVGACLMLAAEERATGSNAPQQALAELAELLEVALAPSGDD